MFRTSSYTIYVDLPKTTEEMLLVHGYTGAYDRVSRRVATYLRAHEAHTVPRALYGAWCPEESEPGVEPSLSQETLDALRRRGYLTHLSREQEEELLKRIVSKIHRIQLQSVPAYVFMPTYDCNLRCPYCFQDHMRTEGRFKHLLRTMSRSTVDRIFTAMTHLERLHGYGEDREVPHRRITFFGGEPLLAQSRPIIEYIFEKARALGETRFSAVSNATELDRYEELLGPEGISNLQITLDGPPEEHDQRRVYEDGRGSFDRIADNLTMALERDVHVTVRMNIDRHNLEHLPKLAREMVRRGWHRYEKFMAYVAPIRADNARTDTKTTLSMWELDQEVLRLRQSHEEMQVIARTDDSTRLRAQQIFGGESQSYSMMKSSFCGAHSAMYVFDALGDIYTCWERTGDRELRVGHIDQDGFPELRAEILQTWRTRTAASNPACAKCRYALFCGGGCAIQAQIRSGTHFKSFCDGFRFRFRASVADAYAAFLVGAENGDRLSEACAV
jgi:uncharacterized protein